MPPSRDGQRRARFKALRSAESRLVELGSRVHSYVAGHLPPRVLRVGKIIITDVGRHDLSGLAAELSYRLFLALFPFLILLISLASFIAKASGIDNPAQEVVDSLGNALPQDTADVLRRQVDGIVAGRNVGLVSFGIIGTLWAAAGGIGAVVKATNRVYSLGENRGFIKRSLLAIGLTLTAGVSLLLASIILVGAQVYSGRLGDAIGIGDAFTTLVGLARFPVAIVLIVLGAETLYWAAPNTKARFRLGTVGALFFTLTWIVMTSVFGLYVSKSSSYNVTYGALGGVVVLLVWLYLTSFLLLLGAEVNAALERDAAAQNLEEESHEGGEC